MEAAKQSGEHKTSITEKTEIKSEKITFSLGNIKRKTHIISVQLLVIFDVAGHWSEIVRASDQPIPAQPSDSQP